MRHAECNSIQAVNPVHYNATELKEKNQKHTVLYSKKSLCCSAHTDGALSSKRQVRVVGGLDSTEFQMDLTNNNGVDVAFSNVGHSFRYMYTLETQKAANTRL